MYGRHSAPVAVIPHGAFARLFPRTPYLDGEETGVSALKTVAAAAGRPRARALDALDLLHHRPPAPGAAS